MQELARIELPGPRPHSMLQSIVLGRRTDDTTVCQHAIQAAGSAAHHICRRRSVGAAEGGGGWMGVEGLLLCALEGSRPCHSPASGGPSARCVWGCGRNDGWSESSAAHQGWQGDMGSLGSAWRGMALRGKKDRTRPGVETT